MTIYVIPLFAGPQIYSLLRPYSFIFFIGRDYISQAPVGQDEGVVPPCHSVKAQQTLCLGMLLG